MNVNNLNTNRTEGLTKRWQAESLIKRLLLIENENEIVEIVASALLLQCEQEFMEAVSTLSTFKYNEITRVIRQNPSQFQNRMDFISEQSTLLLGLPEIPESFSGMDEQIEGDLAQTNSVLTEVQEKIESLERALRWKQWESEALELVKQKKYAAASQVVEKLRLEVELFLDKSLLAQSISLPDISLLSSRFVNEVWMKRVMDLSVGSEVLDLDAVQYFVSRDFGFEYIRQRMILFRQLNTMEEYLLFFYVEQKVQVLSRGRQRELWALFEAKIFPSTSVSNPIHILQLAQFIRQYPGMECSPALLARFLKQEDELFSSSLDLFSRTCVALLQDRRGGVGISCQEVIQREISKSVKDISFWKEWLGNGVTTSGTSISLESELIHTLRTTLYTVLHQVEGASIERSILLHKMSQHFKFLDLENECRESLQILFVDKLTIEYSSSQQPVLNAQTKLEPHQELVGFLAQLKTQLELIPREFQPSFHNLAISKLLAAMDHCLFQTPELKINPLALKMFLLDVQHLQLSVSTTHEDVLEEMHSILSLFCTSLEGLKNFAKEKYPPDDEATTTSCLRPKVKHLLEHFCEMDSSSRLFAPKEVKKWIVDTRGADIKKILQEW